MQHSLIAVTEPSQPPSVVVVKTEPLEGRSRRISASIDLPHAIEQVWQILTDYEHLADFIPSLTRSRQLPHPDGGIRIEQVGAQNFMNFKFCARVVLDMIESFPHRLAFEMVEGDFKRFEGNWELEPLASPTQTPATRLSYTVTILPPRTMPIAMIERRLSSSLAANLEAIHRRAEAIASA